VAAHLADGVSRAWRGDLGGAIQSFDAAIAIAPKFGDAYLNRSLVYARLGDEERALNDANEAVHHARDEARALYNRSVLLRRQGKLAKAQKDEQRAMILDPSYAAVIPK
jgi:tetratricopeptide (TPR) repeat protein